MVVVVVDLFEFGVVVLGVLCGVGICVGDVVGGFGGVGVGLEN